jgi:two-component system response regulator YesN
MKIMIADDEVIIRTGLAKVIKWEELGLELLTPAASAEEVLERIERERPDILLTDIRMSGKTGLQLAEEARQMLPHLEIIIFSGYDNFIYAQQAIRSNVSDYLLKTSKPEEILKTVLGVKKRIEERIQASSRNYSSLREERSRRIERLVIHGQADAQITEIIQSQPHLRVILIRAEGWGDRMNEEALLLFAIDNMSQELLSSRSFVYKNHVVIVMSGSDSQADKLARRDGILRIARLLKCKLFAASGIAVDRIEDLHQSYQTAVAAIAYQAFLKQSYWEYADIEGRKGGRMVCTLDEEKELASILLEDDPIALKLWVQQVIDQFIADPEATPVTLEAAIRSISIAAHRWLDRVQSMHGRTAADVPVQLALDSDQLETNPIESLFHHLFTIMKHYRSQLTNGRSTHVQRAVAYIEESLGHELGLQQVAEHVHLHPNHLSEIFKKETGMKFIDYVAATKIKRATQRLVESNAKISEIAGSVGYEDVKYFGQIFKKHTGKTPSEYREAEWANKKK